MAIGTASYNRLLCSDSSILFSSILPLDLDEIIAIESFIIILDFESFLRLGFTERIWIKVTRSVSGLALMCVLDKAIVPVGFDLILC